LKFSVKNLAEPLIFFLALLALWELLVEIIKVPAFILPPPRDLYAAFVDKFYILYKHALITFLEAVEASPSPLYWAWASPSAWSIRAICRIPSTRSS